MSTIRLFLFLFLTAASGLLSAQDVIISSVDILNVRTGELLQNRWILISEGKIQSILSEKPDAVSARIIDGTGLVAVPGLAEMHAHIPSPDWGRKNIGDNLFLYLSNGITTIRGMLGHPVHLELRAASERGDILAPRIFVSSPSLNGNTVRTTDEARQKVTAYAEAGYDFLKIHPGIKLDVFDAVVNTAREAGIPFAGHVPVDVGIVHALESGYASVDHVDGFLEGLVPPAADVSPTDNGFFGFNFTDLADISGIKRLASLSREYGVWVVPTQSLFERWFSPEPAEVYLSAPEMVYMPGSILRTWENSKNDLLQGDGFDEEKWRRFNDIRRKLIYTLQHEGQGILLGSDAPQVFNVPGFSIHHEMKGMQDAGLTNLEILQAGTINPAAFFGMTGKFGEVIAGASADLLLVKGNPAESLEALKNPEYVVVRGRVLSRGMIDKRLSEIAENSIDE